MSSDAYMVEGDTAPSRVFGIIRNGSAVDLTDCTVRLILRDSGSNSITNEGHQVCTVADDPTTGVATYQFQEGDIASPNVHLGDLKITYPDGHYETDYNYIMIHVRPRVTTVS